MRVGLALAAASAALIAILPGAPACAQETTAAPVPDQARIDRARELSRLISPYDVLLAANLSGWEAAIARSMALDPTAVSLEARYPGIGRAAIDAARPIARRYCETFVNRITDKKAEIFAQRLTAEEIDEVLRFYRTPLGQRAVKQLFSNFDSAQLGREIAEEKARTGTVEITREEMKAKELLAARRAGGSFSADDQIAMLRFSQMPAARKFAAASEAAEQEVIRMANNPDPAFMAAQTEAVTAAMVAFATPRKRR